MTGTTPIIGVTGELGGCGRDFLGSRVSMTWWIREELRLGCDGRFYPQHSPRGTAERSAFGLAGVERPGGSPDGARSADLPDRPDFDGPTHAERRHA